MQERIARARSLFYGGLLIMLTTAILSATNLPAEGSSLLTGLTVIGAFVALGARLRLLSLRRALRHHGPHFGTPAT